MNGGSLALVICVSVLLFVLLLLLIPLRLKICYNGEETVAVFKYLFFRFTLYPKKEGKAQKNKDKKEKEQIKKTNMIQKKCLTYKNP